MTSPYQSTSEVELFVGYRRPALVDRTVPCACGGVLRAVDVPAAVAAAVAAHNETARHRLWRVGQAEAAA